MKTYRIVITLIIIAITLVLLAMIHLAQKAVDLPNGLIKTYELQDGVVCYEFRPYAVSCVRK